MMLCVAMKLVVMWICMSLSMVTRFVPSVLALYSILVAMIPCITMMLCVTTEIHSLHCVIMVAMVI